jgi:hypothetical protein
MITVITFYTPEYHDEAMQLIESCNRFSVPCNAYPKTSKGSWVHNCTMKAEVIEEALNEFSHGVVWIDADGRLRNVPSIFDHLNKYDF